MERSIVMYKRFCVGFCLAAGLSAALAQPGVQGGKTPEGSSGNVQQAQRMALRDALQAQRSMGAASHPGVRAERELSARERGELRQQLRQQSRALAGQ